MAESDNTYYGDFPRSHTCRCCGTTFTPSATILKRRTPIYCSRVCQRRAAIGNQDGTRDQRGAKNPNWKGGRSFAGSYYAERYRAKYPERDKASRALRAALSRGDIVRPAVCENCHQPSVEALQGHHDDYNHPLNVRWLCRPCHRARHDWRGMPKHLLTLKEVAYELGTTYNAAWSQLTRGRFPIRCASETPYRFHRADVTAYIERQEVTNPSALLKGGSFVRAKRAKAAANQRLSLSKELVAS